MDLGTACRPLCQMELEHAKSRSPHHPPQARFHSREGRTYRPAFLRKRKKAASVYPAPLPNGQTSEIPKTRLVCLWRDAMTVPSGWTGLRRATLSRRNCRAVYEVNQANGARHIYSSGIAVRREHAK